MKNTQTLDTKASLRDELSVKVLSFKQLNDSTTSNRLTIPIFQRPYVWNNRRIVELLDDLINYANNEYKKGLSYYLGTLLIYHSENGEWQIVDGQQRITTLTLLYKVINRNSDTLLFPWLTYEPSTSGEAIASAYHVLYAAEQVNQLKEIDLFENISFTVVITENLDAAFSLFDSQNNRGIKPDTADILKAYHLRAITEQRFTQEYWAMKWENIQAVERLIPGYYGENEQFLLPFIGTILWRARNWKGKNLDMETPDEIEVEFAKSKQKCKENIVSIRYPLKSGVHFFRYLYHQVNNINTLIGKKSEFEPNPELLAFRKFYATIYTGVSSYMGQFFLLCTSMYYDKFGCEGLYSFSLWLDYLIGNIRLSQRIMKTTFINHILTLYNQNLLDVIMIANEPFEIIDFISNCAVRNIDEAKIKPYSVAGSYLAANRNYYQKHGKNINEKKSWINEQISLSNL